MTTTAELERQKQERLTMFQVRYDSVLEPMKRAAAPPRQGISINEFRRQNLSYIQQFLPPDSEWRGVNLDGCMSEALNVIEPQILNEARYAATTIRGAAKVTGNGGKVQRVPGRAEKSFSLSSRRAG
jgi:hypothetical protein